MRSKLFDKMNRVGGGNTMGQHIHRRRYRYDKVDGLTVRAHRRVMEELLGRKLKPSEVVHHKDGDGRNNDPSNLELLDYQQHCRVESRRLRPGAKLSEDDVQRIQQLIRGGFSQVKIASLFGVARNTICDIAHRRTWAWLE